jgi:hypothetical protein
MKRRAPSSAALDAFRTVSAVGLSLPDVALTTKYDGTPVLKAGGSFMAGLATHPSAEAATLVVRAGLEERAWLLEEAPDTYYLTDYYRHYPLVLVRLSHVTPDALRDLLAVSRRMTLARSRPRKPPADARPAHVRPSKTGW